MRFFLFLVVFVISCQLVWSQNTLIQDELELVKMYRDIKNQDLFDDKIEYSNKFCSKLKKVLNQNEAFKFPFDSLKKFNGLKELKSSDDKLIIFTWLIKNNYDGSFQYSGVVARKESSKINVIELKDNLDPLNARIAGVVEPSNWYGALYLDVITKKIGSKVYYTVLGWDGNSSTSNIRLIDVLTFSGKSLKIGAPIFKNQKEKLNRVYLEYSESAAVNMNYEEKYKRIMFDHLIPETSDLKGIYSFYIPDFSYDCYVWRKDGWHLMEDVIGVNEKDSKNVTIISSDKRGHLRRKSYKNHWESPNDATNPNEFNHVARTPESELQVVTHEKSSKPKKYKNKKQTDPLKPQSIYKKKKKRRRTRYN